MEMKIDQEELRKQELDRQELAECTFAPQITAPPRGVGSSVREDGESVFGRLHAVAKERADKIEEAKKMKEKVEDMENNGYAPKISRLRRGRGANGKERRSASVPVRKRRNKVSINAGNRLCVGICVYLSTSRT